MTPENHRSDLDAAPDSGCSAPTKTQRLARARAVLEQWNAARGEKLQPLDDQATASTPPRGLRADHRSGRHGDPHRAAP